MKGSGRSHKAQRSQASSKGDVTPLLQRILLVGMQAWCGEGGRDPIIFTWEGEAGVTEISCLFGGAGGYGG